MKCKKCKSLDIEETEYEDEEDSKKFGQGLVCMDCGTYQ